MLFEHSRGIRTLTSFLESLVSSFEAVLNRKLCYRDIEQQEIEVLKVSKGNFDLTQTIILSVPI